MFAFDVMMFSVLCLFGFVATTNRFYFSRPYCSLQNTVASHLTRKYEMIRPFCLESGHNLSPGLDNEVFLLVYRSVAAGTVFPDY
jgi:hypothetical protein